MLTRFGGGTLPWGTFAVNLAGSLLLGLLVGLGANPAVMAAAGAGFCGTLTTYSSFSYETLRRADHRPSNHRMATTRWPAPITQVAVRGSSHTPVADTNRSGSASRA